jgi:hypothetical protein
MLNFYDILVKLTEILGVIGKILVYIGMFAGCILLWYLGLSFIIK